MTGRTTRRATAVLASASLATALGLAAPAAAQPQPGVTHYTGTLKDGATWIADVPAHWKGTLVLFSHGFGPLVASDAPSAGSAKALLDQGYAIAGSSYDPSGSMWALNTAVSDQFGTLKAVSDIIGAPRRTIASGYSMGGLVNSLIAQRGKGRIAGAATFCGIVAGGVDLNNYQLNAEYAIRTLLPGAGSVKIRDFSSPGEGADAGKALTSAVTNAQASPEGRARVALAAALLNETDWATGTTPPRDYNAQEAQEEQTLTQGQLIFVESGRYSIEQSAGGDSSSNAGVNYAALVRGSRYYRQIQYLYRQAHLNLKKDLATLTEGAHYTAEGNSLQVMEHSSLNTGHLAVPELTVHTTSDQLVPVEQEHAYAARVRAAGDQALLRQSYVAAIGHCNFTDAEFVAGVETVDRRISTGRWGDTTSPEALNRTADALNLGGGNFVDYRPARLVVQNP